MKTLQDLGEREIVRLILPRYVSGIGSDCAVLARACEEICVTTDPVPTPAAKILGGDEDLYWMGWLSVTINASDLAAAGSTPLGFVAAVEAPGELEVDKFERLLAGIADACKCESLLFTGGNLREADKIAVVGTAIGTQRAGTSITRFGGHPGDIVVAIGTGGEFWRDALLIAAGVSVDQKSSRIFSPKSQGRAMQRLAEVGLVQAAIDNSDGLLPTLTQLADTNELLIELELDKLKVEGPVVSRQGKTIEPSRLWLGWGDWNVICIVEEPKLNAVIATARDEGTSATVLGRCFPHAGGSRVRIRRGARLIEAPRLESERFSKDSWFSVGIQEYLRRLCEVDLP